MCCWRRIPKRQIDPPIEAGPRHGSFISGNLHGGNWAVLRLGNPRQGLHAAAMVPTRQGARGGDNEAKVVGAGPDGAVEAVSVAPADGPLIPLGSLAKQGARNQGSSRRVRPLVPRCPARPVQPPHRRRKHPCGTRQRGEADVDRGLALHGGGAGHSAISPWPSDATLVL